MKTCNNCGTTNHDSAAKCVHCNMENNFTLQGPPIITAINKSANIQCRNCGTEIKETSIKCMQCNFPVVANKPTNDEIGNSHQQSRKVS